MPDAIPRKREEDLPRSSLTPDAPDGAEVVRLADVLEEPIRWLWPGRLAQGKFNLLDGDPGEGKSLVTVDLAARVTTGRPMPGFVTSYAAGDVVFLAGEDGIADTIKPRFSAAGGDPERVHVITSIRRKGKAGFFALDTDGAALRAVVEKTGARLVVVDPITAHLGKFDSYKDAEVRQALAPLVAIGAETGACIVGVRHLSKAEARAVLYRGGGSIAFIGVARGALILGKHPHDPSRRVVAVSKTNLSAEAASWAFRILTDEKHRPFIAWDAHPSELTAEDLVGAMDERGKPKDDDSSTGRAVVFLREALAAGSRPTKEIEEEAREAHSIPLRTLERARAELGVIARPEAGRSKRGAKGRVWMLSLPAGNSMKTAKTVNSATPRGQEDLAVFAEEEAEK